jgi:hypothetical protein
MHVSLCRCVCHCLTQAGLGLLWDDLYVLSALLAALHALPPSIPRPIRIINVPFMLPAFRCHARTPTLGREDSTYIEQRRAHAHYVHTALDKALCTSRMRPDPAPCRAFRRRNASTCQRKRRRATRSWSSPAIGTPPTHPQLLSQLLVPVCSPYETTQSCWRPARISAKTSMRLKGVIF